jgi:hypothetical protein
MQRGEAMQNPSKVVLNIEQEIRDRTFRRVQNLRAELINGQIVVHGSTSSSYTKSLAVEAARKVRALICPTQLLLDIQVN